MNFDPVFLSAFTAGILGSLHCVGMCGGIATALGMGLKESTESGKPAIAGLFFQFGRISSYAVAGYLAGTLGDVLTASDTMQDASLYLRIFSAVFMIGLGLNLAGWFPFFTLIEKVGVPVWKKISPLSRYFLPVRQLHQAYALGLLWGWIPCGLTYSILLWSVAAGSAVSGSLLMTAFGLGTIPAMLTMTLGAGKIHRVVKQVAVRVIAGLLILAGGIYVLQYSINLLILRHDQASNTQVEETVKEEGQHQH